MSLSPEQLGKSTDAVEMTYSANNQGSSPHSSANMQSEWIDNNVQMEWMDNAVVESTSENSFGENQEVVCTTSEEDDNSPMKKKQQQPIEPTANEVSFTRAVMAFVASAAFHSAFSLCIKLSSKSFPVPQIMWSRYITQWLCTSAILLYRRQSPFGPPGAKGFLFSRGLAGVLSQTCHTFAVTRMPLGDAVSVHAMYPVITALLAPIFLGEDLTVTAVLAAFAATTGCVLIARGKHGGEGSEYGYDDPWMGLGAALLGAFFASVTYMLIRRLRSGGRNISVKPEVVVWCYSSVSLVMLTVALPGTFPTFSWDADTTTWVALIAVGGVSIAEQLLVTLGFAGVSAGVGTLLMTLETGFAFLFGWLVLHDQIKFMTILGALLIALAVGSTAISSKLPCSKKLPCPCRFTGFGGGNFGGGLLGLGLGFGKQAAARSVGHQASSAAPQGKGVDDIEAAVPGCKASSSK